MKNLAIIGFGHMGSAIVAGAVRAGAIKPGDVTVADSSPQALERAAALGVKTTPRAEEAVIGQKTVLLAVKPNNLPELAKLIKNRLEPGAVVVSICAGKRLETLAELFGDIKLIRVMPNTPALVGEGMSALCANKNVSEAELFAVAEIFKSLGRAEILPERLFDSVTAVSGSGPAYVYSFICGLMKYAEESGMSPETAKLFAAQTVLGSAKMVLQSNDPPEKLKQNICTPGGTTVEAVKVLDGAGFEDIVSRAAKACELKSKALAEK